MYFIMLSRQNKEYQIRQTLIQNKYRETKKQSMADIAFTHADTSIWKKRLINFKKPIFLYPHSPDCWQIYDIGGVKPWNRIACNFVPSQRVKEILEFLHYPCPIEIIGFPYTKKVLPLTVGNDKKILFAPHHTDNGKLDEHKKKMNLNVLGSLATIKNHKSITVYLHHSLMATGIYGIPDINYSFSNLTITSAINIIKKYDIIVGYGTFLQLAVALGKPTISFDTRTPFYPWNLPDLKMNHPELMDGWKYPVDLYDYASPETAIEAAKSPIAIMTWKEQVLGPSFKPDVIIEEIRKIQLDKYR